MIKTTFVSEVTTLVGMKMETSRLLVWSGGRLKYLQGLPPAIRTFGTSFSST